MSSVRRKLPRDVFEVFAGQLVLVGKGDRVDHEIEPAPALGEAGEHRIEARLGGHVGLDHEIAADAFGQRPHPPAQRLALIGEGELGAVQRAAPWRCPRPASGHWRRPSPDPASLPSGPFVFPLCLGSGRQDRAQCHSSYTKLAARREGSRKAGAGRSGSGGAGIEVLAVEPADIGEQRAGRAGRRSGACW